MKECINCYGVQKDEKPVCGMQIGSFACPAKRCATSDAKDLNLASGRDLCSTRDQLAEKTTSSDIRLSGL